MKHHLTLEKELLDTLFQREDHPYRLFDCLVPLFEFMHQRIVQLVPFLGLPFQCVNA